MHGFSDTVRHRFNLSKDKMMQETPNFESLLPCSGLSKHALELMVKKILEYAVNMAKKTHMNGKILSMQVFVVVESRASAEDGTEDLEIEEIEDGTEDLADDGDGFEEEKEMRDGYQDYDELEEEEEVQEQEQEEMGHGGTGDEIQEIDYMSDDTDNGGFEKEGGEAVMGDSYQDYEIKEIEEEEEEEEEEDHNIDYCTCGLVRNDDFEEDDEEEEDDIFKSVANLETEDHEIKEIDEEEDPNIEDYCGLVPNDDFEEDEEEEEEMGAPPNYDFAEDEEEEEEMGVPPNYDFAEAEDEEEEEMGVPNYDFAEDEEEEEEEMGVPNYDFQDNYRLVPASASSIEGLEIVKVEQQEGSFLKQGNCAICFEDFNVGVRMPCSHIFHGDCITNWLQVGNSCPLCRFQMPTDHDQMEE